jgi:hypothetical protein
MAAKIWPQRKEYCLQYVRVCLLGMRKLLINEIRMKNIKQVMVRSFVSGFLVVAVVLGFSASVVQTASAQTVTTATNGSGSTLTQAQINSIIGLLQVFGADKTVISNVSAALTGVPSTDVSSSDSVTTQVASTNSIIPPVPPVTPINFPTNIENKPTLPPADNSSLVQQVTQLYQTYLGRQPEEQGLYYWVDSGLSISQIQAGIQASAEYQTRLENINNLYVTLLGRQAESQGLNYWATSGLTIPQIQAGIMASAEYLADHQNGVATTTVNVSTPITPGTAPSPYGSYSNSPKTVAPVITSLSPTSVRAGSVVTIYGSGFDANSYVSFSSASAQQTGAIVTPPSSFTPTSLTFTIPMTVAWGKYLIQVDEEVKGYGPDSNIVGITVTPNTIPPSIPPSISINSPTVGTTLMAGSRYMFNATGPADLDNVIIVIQNSVGQPVRSIGADVVAANSTFAWTIPSGWPTGNYTITATSNGKPVTITNNTFSVQGRSSTSVPGTTATSTATSTVLQNTQTSSAISALEALIQKLENN